MTENKAKTYSIIVKTAICVIIGLLAVILVWQYANINALNNQNQQLQAEYSALAQEHEDILAKKQAVENNYEDYVADYVRDNFDYTQQDEILINKK